MLTPIRKAVQPPFDLLNLWTTDKTQRHVCNDGIAHTKKAQGVCTATNFEGKRVHTGPLSQQRTCHASFLLFSLTTSRYFLVTTLPRCCVRWSVLFSLCCSFFVVLYFWLSTEQLFLLALELVHVGNGALLRGQFSSFLWDILTLQSAIWVDCDQLTSVLPFVPLHHFHDIVPDSLEPTGIFENPSRRSNSAPSCTWLRTFFNLRLGVPTAMSWVDIGCSSGGIVTGTSALRLGGALTTAGRLLLPKTSLQLGETLTRASSVGTSPLQLTSPSCGC